MNLGARCEEMLENRCQCSNTAMDNSPYCNLHLILHAATTTTKDVNLSDKKDTDAANKVS